MMVGIHALLADRTNTPELAIEQSEAKLFMDSAQKVMRHYSVETTQKTLDMVAMIGTVGTIYGPRIVAINIRKAAEAEAKRMGAGVVAVDISGAANVHHFNPNGNVG